MALSCNSKCPTLLYLKRLATSGEDPAARCNELGKEHEQGRKATATCPLQRAADAPRG